MEPSKGFPVKLSSDGNRVIVAGSTKQIVRRPPGAAGATKHVVWKAPGAAGSRKQVVLVTRARATTPSDAQLNCRMGTATSVLDMAQYTYYS